MAFVGHSFHQQTRSSWFVVELLRRFADVDVFWDDSWRGGGGVQAEISQKHYDAVVLWQNFEHFDYEAFRQRGITNITVVPMYDQSGRLPLSAWFRHRRAKVLSFSSALHARVTAAGLHSLRVQYYQPLPEALPAMPSGGAGRLASSGLAFLWQRGQEVTWKTVLALLGPQRVSRIHIHATPLPSQTLDLPSEDEAQRLGISLSTWFETKEEYLRLVRDCDVYFAPRVLEGIGQSFVEALALGKCVVAPDRPTMNEYISHGVDGLLYDPANPRPLDFSHIDAIRAAARARYERGLERWNSEEANVVRYILDDPLPAGPSAGFMAVIRVCDFAASLPFRIARKLKRIRTRLLGGGPA